MADVLDMHCFNISSHQHDLNEETGTEVLDGVDMNPTDIEEKDDNDFNITERREEEEN